MRLAVFDDNGLIENVYSGDPTSIANLKSMYDNHLEIADDVEIDFTRPSYVKDGKLEQPELVAEELLLAQKEMSSITGEFSTEDLLGEIFSRFCIGK